MWGPCWTTGQGWHVLSHGERHPEGMAIEDKKNASRLTKNEGSNGLPLFAEQEVGIFVTKRAPDLRGESEGGGRQGLQEGESGRWERGRGGARGSASGSFSW